MFNSNCFKSVLIQTFKVEKGFVVVCFVSLRPSWLHITVAKDALELLISLSLPFQVLGPQAFVTMPGLCSAEALTNLGHTAC